jgi:hypothetical protein
VTKWRKALDVPQVNEGKVRLYQEYAPERLTPEVRAKADAAANTPEANAKKSAAKKGRLPHPKAVEVLRRANVGRKLSNEHRRKLSEAHRQRGTLVPGTVPWSAEELALLGTMPDEEVTQRTGRPLKGVVSMRQRQRIRMFNARGRGFATKDGEA